MFVFLSNRLGVRGSLGVTLLATSMLMLLLRSF
jgi:hypothetical protein